MNAEHQADMMFVYTMSISSETALSTSTRRLSAHIVNSDILDYSSMMSSDAMTYWTMTGTHVARDSSSTMGTHQLHLAWFTYNCCTESYTKPPVGLTPLPYLLPYIYVNSRASSHFG